MKYYQILKIKNSQLTSAHSLMISKLTKILSKNFYYYSQKNIYQVNLKGQEGKPKLFQFFQAQDSDAKQIAIQYGLKFSQVQPVVDVNVSPQQFSDFVSEVLKYSLKDKLTFGLRQLQTGKIATSNICVDCKYDSEINFELYPTLQPLFHVLDQISKDFLQENKVHQTKGKFVHLWMGVTQDKFENSGLLSILLKRMMKIFHERKFQYAVSQLTSPATRRIFVDKLKYFKPIKSLNYSESQYQGRKYYKEGGGFAQFVLADLKNLNLEQL